MDGGEPLGREDNSIRSRSGRRHDKCCRIDLRGGPPEPCPESPGWFRRSHCARAGREFAGSAHHWAFGIGGPIGFCLAGRLPRRPHGQVRRFGECGRGRSYLDSTRRDSSLCGSRNSISLDHHSRFTPDHASNKTWGRMGGRANRLEPQFFCLTRERATRVT
jgi:hypothetical protein